MKLDYLLMDVFTQNRFAGNQLAVVPNAERLLDGQMQAIASEFNLSETIFLLKPDSELNSARARIFTPVVEMPFAGHPTLGAAVALGLRSKASVIRLEEDVGLVTALFEKTGPASGRARFTLPQLPERAGVIGSVDNIAQALGIDQSEIGFDGFGPATFSAGNVFHLVPVRDKSVLARISLNEGVWRAAFPGGRHSVYVFTKVLDEPGLHFAARKLTPGYNEDPGTGSAVAALIGLLAEAAGNSSTQTEYVVRQGYEIGRPCEISLQFRGDGTKLVHCTIGGHAVIVGGGHLDLDD